MDSLGLNWQVCHEGRGRQIWGKMLYLIGRGVEPPVTGDQLKAVGALESLEHDRDVIPGRVRRDPHTHSDTLVAVALDQAVENFFLGWGEFGQAVWRDRRPDCLDGPQADQNQRLSEP